MKDKDSARLLRDIVATLDDMIQNKEANCTIMPDNGYDESVIIGTVDSFLVVAKRLLEIVYAIKSNDLEDKGIEAEELLGVNALSTNIIESVFDDLGLVWPICAYVVSDDTQQSKLADGFDYEGIKRK